MTTLNRNAEREAVYLLSQEGYFESTSYIKGAYAGEALQHELSTLKIAHYTAMLSIAYQYEDTRGIMDYTELLKCLLMESKKTFRDLQYKAMHDAHDRNIKYIVFTIKDETTRQTAIQYASIEFHNHMMDVARNADDERIEKIHREKLAQIKGNTNDNTNTYFHE